MKVKEGAPAAQRILVVEDDPIYRAFLRAKLEAESYVVLEAADGVGALALLERETVAAIVSDILMPNMDGYRLCEEIRKSARWHALPFIFLSGAFNAPEDEALARSAGGDRFVNKGAVVRLPDALRDLLARRRTSARRDVPGALGAPDVTQQFNARLVAKLEEQNAELREREHQLRLFITHSPAAIAVLDRDLRYLLVSNRWLADYRLPDQDIVGRSHYDVFPEIPERWKEIHRRCLGGAVEKNDADVFPRADGSTDWVRWEIHPWYSPEKVVGGLIMFSEVITERKQAQLQLERAAQRLRALSRRLVDAQDIEQRRLSAELHDRIGQNLTALGINLNMIGSSLPPSTAVELKARLQDSRELLEGTMVTMRELIAELRPPALDDYGLLAGLRWYGAQVQARSGMVTVVEGDEPAPRLAGPVEGALYRIAQEALTNTVKHAQARKASLRLRARNGKVTLTIADDGAGFDLASVNQRDPHMHWGLMMMQERANAVGAQLRVESAPGQGTRIVVDFAGAA